TELRTRKEPPRKGGGRERQSARLVRDQGDDGGRSRFVASQSDPKPRRQNSSADTVWPALGCSSRLSKRGRDTSRVAETRGIRPIDRSQSPFSRRTATAMAADGRRADSTGTSVAYICRGILETKEGKRDGSFLPTFFSPRIKELSG